MKKDILVGVICSLLTAVILSLAATAAGLFKTKLTETQVNEAAEEIINEHIDVLILKLKGDSDFLAKVKGDKGDKGELGQKGDKGNDGKTEEICDRVISLQGRSGTGHYIGENAGKVYSKKMPNNIPGSYEKFKIICP